MSNTNNTMQTQTSNTLHNAIMEVDGKDRPPMLAPSNYVQWKSIIKRYIDTKPNHELIQYCLKNPLYKSQQAATRNRGKAIFNSPIYDQKPSMVAEDDEMHVARECQKPKRVKDEAYHKENMLLSYHKEKMLLCKQEEVGFQLNAEQADWRDDTDDESEDQELEAHYMYMAQIQEVTPDVVTDSRTIFDTEPLQKVSNYDHYNVFAIESEHPEQSKSVHDTYPIEQDEHNVIIDSLDMSYDREQIDQNDDNDLANERELLASLIEKLKCEIVDSKNRNKFLETSNKVLVDKLKGEIEAFKTKNKSLESSNNRFKKANNKLSETNELMYKHLKKFQAELDRRNDVKYASKMEIDCAKAKGDLISYKIKSKNSFNAYTQKINDLNQTISEMKKELFAHQETISILSQAKEAQIKLYKTREDKELDKVIALENKVKVLDNIVYKTSQSVQTMNMLNRNCKTSFTKPELLKKSQRANPRLETVDQDDDDLANERDLLASLIEKLNCEIDDRKNHNKFLETSNKALVDKLKGEIGDFKTKNKSLESSNNHFKEANNELSKKNQIMFKDLKKFQAELENHHDVNYMSKVEINSAKAKGDLISYKMESQKSLTAHTQNINDLNQMIFEMKKELLTHQETIFIMSQQKEDQTKAYKTCEDKEIKKVIAVTPRQGGNTGRDEKGNHHNTLVSI
uniref:Uncharacterized protein n=1 Tax=Tanacetum cinerariifolium TaxID=118510 RepID=A0A6L2N9J9_TANCI|nr:hypothetical protein [Tanacetum cinerariifolium]